MRNRFELTTQTGQKREIEIVCGNFENLGICADLLICSAFKGDYMVTRTSLIGCLYRSFHISVRELAAHPELDLKDLGVWISQSIANQPFLRIGCVEMSDYRNSVQSLFETLFFAISRANARGFAIETIALPLLGTGNQGMDDESIFLPLWAECVSAFHYIPQLKKILFFERNRRKYDFMCKVMEESLGKVAQKMVFISYSHRDQAIADSIAEHLEKRGVKVWIDHRKIRNPSYAEEIVKAIQASSVFLILVSTASQQSADVRRELHNAAYCENEGKMLLYPILLEKIDYSEIFSYYLRGHDYTDISEEPVEEKIEAFSRKLCEILHL